MREAVRELASLGPLEPEDQLQEQKAERYEQLLHKIDRPVSDDEARALIRLFGPDNGFGLAWTILHLVETAPGWPLWDALTDPTNEWIRRLRQRLQNAGIQPPGDAES